MLKTVPKGQIEPLDLYVEMLVGARNPLKRHYTQPWLDLTWNMHLHGAWNPHLKKDINKLENIQMKASRFVKSCNSRDPGTVTGLLADLEWKSLKQMRTKHDLTLFYRAINGHIEIPLPPIPI